MDLSEMKIMILDHMAAFREVMKTTLEKEGYTIHTGNDGEKAVKEILRIMPDLIILEADLPKKNGYHLCRELKENKKTSHIPVIFVTTKDDMDNMEEAFNCGCVDYIVKPFRKMDLAARVKNHLQTVYLRKEVEKQSLLKGVIEMAGATAHELNQPLSVILMNSELLLTPINEKNPAFKRLKRIEENAKRMAEAIKKITSITEYQVKDYIEGVKIVDINKASTK